MNHREWKCRNPEIWWAQIVRKPDCSATYEQPVNRGEHPVHSCEGNGPNSKIVKQYECHFHTLQKNASEHDSRVELGWNSKEIHGSLLLEEEKRSVSRNKGGRSSHLGQKGSRRQTSDFGFRLTKGSDSSRFAPYVKKGSFRMCWKKFEQLWGDRGHWTKPTFTRLPHPRYSIACYALCPNRFFLFVWCSIYGGARAYEGGETNLGLMHG